MDNNERWKSVLTGRMSGLRVTRRIFGHIPSAPRCKLCASPFGKPGSGFMRLMGKTRWELNPWLCTVCARSLGKNVGGAEVVISLLFADLRGSTTIAEQIPAAEFARLLNRFYDTVAAVVDRNDGLVDKLIGDGVMGLFIPAFSSDADHARHAIEAGRELLEKLGTTTEGQREIPVGVGVHTGLAFVGVVGSGKVLDFTAVGDATNAASRLGSSAAAGELLVSKEAADTGRLAVVGFERRVLELKGRTEPLEVYVLMKGQQPDDQTSKPQSPGP